MQDIENTPRHQIFRMLRRSHANALFWLMPIALLSLYFVAGRAHFLLDFSEESYSPYFWAKRYSTYFHIAGGAIALGIGLVQVWLGATRRTGTLHRQLGWTYVAVVAISVVAAFAMIAKIPSGYLAYSSGLLLNAIVWAVATGIAVWAMRCRRVDLHRDWMIRSYLMAFAFTIARLMLPAFRAVFDVPADPIADGIQATTAWACWVIPLLLFEVYKSARTLIR